MSFKEAGGELIARTEKALYRAGTMLMAESQPLVPVDSGTLKRSGHVEEPVVNGSSVTVTVGYGYGVEYEGRAGEQEPDGPGYGLYVHERLDVKHDPPTQAKYLEQPAQTFGPQFRAILDEEMRR